MTSKIYICKNCGHEVTYYTDEVTYYTDIETTEPKVCSVCKLELQEKQSTI